VDDALRRIGKLSGYTIRPIIPADDEFHYRRRIRLQAGAGNELGFYAASSHELLTVDACWIAEKPLNQVLADVRRWARALNTELDRVEIVAGDAPRELIVAANARESFVARDEPSCAALVAGQSAITGLILAGRDWRKVWGEPRITVDSGEIVLRVDADVFTQVNPSGNRRMLKELLDAGDFHADDRVLELYCGAGNFTLPMARRSKSVLAMEGDRAALQNAKLNAQKSGINNIHWICAPVPTALAEQKRKRERFSKIVLDPPRAGAKGIEKHIAALGAEKIIYISCNPTTLARDVAGLAELGYKLDTVQPIDLFPQIFHVETLAILQR
jgi:23S rRNA (uracil1939-C5)-methyltransferase